MVSVVAARITDEECLLTCGRMSNSMFRASRRRSRVAFRLAHRGHVAAGLESLEPRRLLASQPTS